MDIYITLWACVVLQIVWGGAYSQQMQSEYFNGAVVSGFFFFLSEVRKQIDLHRKIEFMDCDVRWKCFLLQPKLKSEGFPWVLKVLLVIELSCTKKYREMHLFKSCRTRGINPLCGIHSGFLVFWDFFFPFWYFCTWKIIFELDLLGW